MSGYQEPGKSKFYALAQLYLLLSQDSPILCNTFLDARDRLEDVWFAHTHLRMQPELDLQSMIRAGLIAINGANESTLVVVADKEVLFAYFMKHLEVTPIEAELVWLEVTVAMAGGSSV